MSKWYERGDAAVVMAPYCAPTVVAGIFGCSKVEAAETLLAAGLAHETVGSVHSKRWHCWLREEFGGVALETERPDGQERWREAWERFEERDAAASRGETWRWPREPSYKAATRYTVSQFLKIHPEGMIVLSISGHTLLAKDGEVVRDTRWSKSKRGRVLRATLLKGGT